MFVSAKGKQQRRFDSFSVKNSVLIISRITFRDCRVHIFPTTFLEIAVNQGLKDSAWQTRNTLNMVAFVRPKILKTPTWRLQLICKEY